MTEYIVNKTRTKINTKTDYQSLGEYGYNGGRFLMDMQIISVPYYNGVLVVPKKLITN